MSEAEPEQNEGLGPRLQRVSSFAGAKLAFARAWLSSFRFREWLWDRGWFVLIPLAIIGLVIWSPLFQVQLVIAAEPHTLYLLSAMAQSLAAVLALVFTISLIAAQLSSRYSHRMLAGFFDPTTILYILLFIAAVLLPFWLLANPNPFGVKFSLTLSAACLFFLVPYFLSFKDRLSPEKMLEDLKRKGSQHLRASSDGEPAEISTIDNTVMSAFGFKDYDTFGVGVKCLADLALDAYKNKKGIIGVAVLDRLRDIAIVAIEDPRAPLQVLEKLDDVGVVAAEKGLGDAAWQAADRLGDVGVTAANKGMEDAAGGVVFSLGDVGVVAAEKGLEGAAGWAADRLGNVGVVAAEKGLGDAAWQAADRLGVVGVTAAEEGLGDAAERAAYYLGEVYGLAGGLGLRQTTEAAAVSLWILGAWARFKNLSKLEKTAGESLRKINSPELTKSTYDAAHNYFPGICSSLLAALEAFQSSCYTT